MTFIELMMTVLILAVLLMIAAPSMSEFFEVKRLKKAAEAVASDFHYARSEAIKRNAQVFIKFDTSDWCYGLDETNSCDCKITDVGNASACTLPVAGTNVLETVASDDFSDVTLSSASFGGNDFSSFLPIRGTASSGTVTLTSASGKEIQVRLSVLGQVLTCSPSGANNVNGYSTC